MPDGIGSLVQPVPSYERTSPGVAPNAWSIATKTRLGAEPQMPSIRGSSPYAWHYSYGHWVEDDPQGDRAYSSPGLFGFYPWIDASKKHYGMIVRHAFTRDAYMQSVHCGQAIRRALNSG